MSNIQIFSNNEFGEIRTVIIEGEPWFVSKDISENLGYTRTSNMVKLVDDEDKRNISSSDLEQQGYNQNYTIGIINESGLYAAIFGSKQENAKSFKRWVTSEVLPSIRRTGTYGQPQLPTEPMELLKIHYAALEQVDKKVSDVGSKVETLEERFTKFEQELPMLPDDADEVHDCLNKRVVFLLGGKESNAYRNKSLSKKVFMDAYRVLKHNFNVSRYKAIKRNQKAKAIEVIQKYEPPFFLAQQIESVNAQQSLNLKGGATNE